MLSPDENFELLAGEDFIEAYMAEMRGYDAIRSTVELPAMLNRIVNNTDSYCSGLEIPDPMEFISGVTDGSRIIEVSNPSIETRNKFHEAHLAAIVILHEDFQFPLEKLHTHSFISDCQNIIRNMRDKNPQATRVVMQRLIGIDAVRTMQLLRSYGLIERKSDEMHQLGLGVATGAKDIHFVHMVPTASIVYAYEGRMIKFSSIRNRVNDIIISDLDPRHSELFSKMTEDPMSPATCYVCDVNELLEKLSKLDVAKRNIVTMLRVEPAMIPDSIEFLRLLYPVIDESCDFVLSIGSGDNEEAYKKRIDLVSDIFGKLDDAGLAPVICRMHLGGSVINQAKTLQYGSSTASSYEILYCKLSSRILKKVYG